MITPEPQSLARLPCPKHDDDSGRRRAVSSRHSAARRKVEAALAGELALAELSEEEGVVFNAEICAAIQESLADADYGKVLAGRGITTVALDEDDVEHRPDGTSVVVTGR
jgi:hypothetical protein